LINSKRILGIYLSDNPLTSRNKLINQIFHERKGITSAVNSTFVIPCAIRILATPEIMANTIILLE
jgi:hypothetical protein